MRLMGLTLFGVMLSFSLGSISAEHPACINPFLEKAVVTPDESRGIAISCTEEEIASLFYNRAYHQELLDNFRSMTRLESYAETDDMMHYEAQRIYIGLAEAFTRSAWNNGNLKAVSALNEQYDQAIAVGELQIRRNEVLARQEWLLIR
ncbi:MAG: hypothetical protein ABW116_09295 [Candidatus Sedimenticola sp. 20ELBAFRAG]